MDDEADDDADEIDEAMIAFLLWTLEIYNEQLKKLN